MRNLRSCIFVFRLTTRCWDGFIAMRVFFVCVVSVRFVSDATVRLAVVFAETVVDCVRFVARAASSLAANVVWNTDKPRHTAKNSIILFIP